MSFEGDCPIDSADWSAFPGAVVSESGASVRIKAQASSGPMGITANVVYYQNGIAAITEAQRVVSVQ